MARYPLASYCVFGVMSPGLFGFGVSLALERDGGLLTLKRALPAPPGAYLLGKMPMAMAVAGLVVLVLPANALMLAHVRLTPRQAECCSPLACWACCRSARWGCSSAP
ncbi:MAG TPA: hypothetical protein VF216_02840 [Mizugakiibacter sp.]